MLHVNKTSIRLLAPLCLIAPLALACGGAKTRPDNPKPPGLRYASDDVAKSIEILDADPLTVPEPEIDAIKQRGDAFFREGDTIYRGASAGLVVGEINGEDQALKEIAFVPLPGAVTDILVRGSVAYVSCGSSGVAVIDVADPQNPTHKTTIDTLGAALRLAFTRNLLLIADGAMGIVVVDIETPFSPRVVSLWPSKGYVRDIVVDKRSIYVAEDRAGVSLLRLKLTGELSLQWRKSTGSQARSVLRRGESLLLVANGDAGLLVLNVEKRKHPEELGRLETTDRARDVATVPGKNIAYIATGDDGITIVDIRNPNSLSVKGVKKTDTPANRVYVIDNQLYIGIDSQGLLVLDITDPENPQ